MSKSTLLTLLIIFFYVIEIEIAGWAQEETIRISTPWDHLLAETLAGAVGALAGMWLGVEATPTGENRLLALSLTIPSGATAGVAIYGATQRIQGNLVLAWLFGVAGLYAGGAILQRFYDAGVIPDENLIIVSGALFIGFSTSVGYNIGASISRDVPSAVTSKNKPPVISDVLGIATFEPLTWYFKADATDPDDDIASYRWDFGDGTMAEGISVRHTYAAPGVYRVCVEVRDRQDLTERACKTIAIEQPIKPNQPPRADFRWSAPLLEDGQPIQFISDSTDPEGALASLEWDFGDGTRQTTTAQTISHTFVKAGTYRVCLTAKDSGGLSNQTCKEIKISQRWAAPSNEKTRYFMSVVSRDNNRQPSWSPDGKLIMFTSDRDMDWELYTINLDTQAVSRVTKSLGPDFNPSWCRDGKVIFVSDRDGQRGTDLYVLDMTTLGVTRLTHDPAYLNIAPSCAPDGRTVIFTTNRDGDFEIYSITTETRAVNRITFSPVQDWNPQVSPDGKYIAFQSQVQGNSEIYVMDINGRNLRRLTFNPGEDVEPAWSPDGKKIAFASNRDGNFKIYVIDVTGENEVVLTPDTNNNLHPVWSPDGRKIAFESDRTRNWEIWVMDADGKNLKRLTGVSK